MSLSIIALQCAQLLAQAQTSQTLGPIKRTIEDTLVRFKIWAGNVGIFAPENASVDYRLRQDDEIVAVLTSILVSLKAHLEQAVSTTIHEEAEDSIDVTVDSQLSSTSSESSCSSISLDSDASASALDVRPTGTGTPAPIDALAKANDEIDRLYRLALVLRKPVSSTENARVRDFIAKKVAANETEDMDDAEDHARSHLQARFPKAAPFLVDRIVSAVVFRRMQLRYRERHQGKLRQGVEQSFFPEAPRTTRLVGSRIIQHNPPAPQSATHSRSEKALVLQAGPSVVFSATNASSVDRARYTKYAESAALSRITHSAVARRLKLDVPAPPRDFDQRLGKVSCSFCMRMISKEEAQEPRWTRHVLKDIKPYICLFPGCGHGDALFSSTEEWLGHLQWQHTIMWACQAAGHENQAFGSEKELERHIRDIHPGSFAESQLPHLVAQGARPAPDTFAMLAMLLESKDPEESLANPCPICRDFQPSTQAGQDQAESGPSGDIQAHILEHLETIALISLPGTEDEGAAGSNVKQSNQNSIEEKMSALDLQSNVSEAPENVTESSTHEPILSGDQNPYVPLEDDQHWREICRDIKMNLPKPEDDPVLLLWYERTNQSSSSHRPRDHLVEQARRWLFPLSLPEDEMRVVNSIKGCADWFLARGDVQEWCSGTPDCQTLWLRGDVGCGKTVLSATVLERLRHTEGRLTLYFSFNGLSAAAQTLDKVIRTLILQLCTSDNRSAEYLATLFSDDLVIEHQPTTESLEQALNTMLESEEPISIILDALTESSPNCNALDGWLIRLISTSGPNVRFLLISDMATRWYDTLESLVERCIEFEPREIEDAMSSFIKARFSDDPAFSSSQIMAPLLEHLRTKIIEVGAMK
ncbi:hypothetical protein B0T11DRAFT_50862 [Plectosphaerella cucumerina]|uniref:Nephrocystin 3-like N-terminal domain-containing protein n=1 Tax=Plectosphaerella cucumerina TaxID=40658 RepID=A0A8K0TL50_9PEZI|nr:hypothetical protein B0T11DRAFT_50862 [Plectosphaerella cucumerina]